MSPALLVKDHFARFNFPLQSTSIYITMRIDEPECLLNLARYFGTESKVAGSKIVTRFATRRYTK
jgi:hypothetical protein